MYRIMRQARCLCYKSLEIYDCTIQPPNSLNEVEVRLLSEVEVERSRSTGLEDVQDNETGKMPVLQEFRNL